MESFVLAKLHATALYRTLKILPANILLGNDVLKTFFVFVFRRHLQVLIKTNIYALTVRLQDVFKTFSRRLQDVLRLQRHLQIHIQDVFKMSSRSTTENN